MLMERIFKMESELKAIHTTLLNLPTWFPLTSEFAKQHHMSLNGLRQWCTKNIHPDHFMKRGHFWYIHKSEIANVRPNIV